MVKLGDICTVVSGSTPSSSVAEYWDGNHIWITPAELSDDSFIIYDSVRHITDRAIQETSLKPFPEGTVILSSRAPIGKTAIAGCKMYCNQGFKNLICSDSIYNKYLYFFLSAKTDYLNSLGRGATFKEISKYIVENIQIYLPTIEEQKKRAGILEKLMFLIQTRKKQLSKLNQLVKSRFIEMFGDPVENPYKWNMTYLNVLGELNRGISKHRPRNAPELLNGKYPLIQTGDIASSDLFITKYSSTYSEFGLKQSRMWPSGTLCITIAANIAKTSILKFDACFPDSVVGFISGKEYMQVFIYFWFSFFQKILEEQAPESAQKNINLKILRVLLKE